LDQQTLQLQAALADVFFDESQALFGVLLNLLEALLEVLPPLGDVFFAQVSLTLSKDFIDQFFQLQAAGARGAIDGRLIWLRIWLARCGTCTQGKTRKRVLLARAPNSRARWVGSQPIHWSRTAHCQAGAPKTTQPKGRPSLSPIQYCKLAPTRLR